MSGSTVLLLSVALLAVVLLSALGIGSGTRMVGLHVPFIHRSEHAWIQGHRTALYVIAPASSISAICGLVDLTTGAHGGTVVLVGWLIWIGGLAVGVVVASAAAYSASSTE